jgi:hypothetical protein
MKSMRAMSKERPDLTVSLVNRRERKKFGDWELEYSKHYRNGRVVDTLKPKRPYKPHQWNPSMEDNRYG